MSDFAANGTERQVGWSLLTRLFVTLILLAFLAIVPVGPVFADDDDDDDKGGRVVLDNFKRDPVGTPLPLHTLEQDTVGGGWIEGIGADFQIDSDGRSARDAGLNLPSKIAFVDSQLNEFDLSVTITRAEPSSLTGMVFRYVDADNYMAAVHNGKRLQLLKVVAGEIYVLDRKSFRSKNDSGDLWSVKVRSDSIKVSINGKRKLKTRDLAFASATAVGLIHQSSLSTSFKNFSVTSGQGGFIPPLAPEPSAPVVLDSFTAIDGTDLGLHTDTEVTSGGSWTEIVGRWEISDGAATLASPDPVRPSGDHIAVIPSDGAPLQEISADVTWQGGFAGLAWNVVNSTSYSLVFWDGVSIVVGRLENGAFHERGRRMASWSPGQTRNLRIQLNEGHAFVYLDDSEPIILAFGIEYPTVLNSGIFDRFNRGNSFDNFTVRNSPAGLNTPSLASNPPLRSAVSGIAPLDVWLFDSFDSNDFMLLRDRSSEVDPSGQGWIDEDGFWMIQQAQASEQSGAFGSSGFDRFAIIDTGVDEYELKSKVEWDGGRAGVFFGGRSTGPDDAGRNGFIFFRSGDFLHVGQLIGGVYFGIGSTNDFKWMAGKSLTLKVEVEGDQAELKLNGKTMFKFSDPALQGSSWAGLFQRGGSDERYNDFTVRLPGER